MRRLLCTSTRSSPTPAAASPRWKRPRGGGGGAGGASGGSSPPPLKPPLTSRQPSSGASSGLSFSPSVNLTTVSGEPVADLPAGVDVATRQVFREPQIEGTAG